MLVGGTQRTAGVFDRDHERLYEAGVAAVLDTGTGTVREVLRHRDEAQVCGGAPGEVGHCLKGISRDGEAWLLNTERSLLWMDGSGEVTRRWSHPRLNDVHHALRHRDVLWVAATGMDTVLEVRGGEVHREHHLGTGDTAPLGDWRARSRKPHEVHPNHLYVREGRVWVTCLHGRSAREVGGSGSLDVADERVHDGVLHDGCVWFTTVDGRLVARDLETGAVRHSVDLKQTSPRSGPLGWCRGLVLDGEVAWVGLTRIRATRWRQNLAWMRGVVRGRQDATAHPTRVLGVRWATGEQIAEWEVEETGLHALFGMEACDPSGAPPHTETGEPREQQ